MADDVTTLRIHVTAARPGWRGWGRLALGLLLTGAASVAADAPVGEAELKAAFVPKVTLFVQWPAECFKSPQDPVLIGLLGGGPIAPYIEQAATGKSVAGRPVRVVRCRSLEEARACHLIFFGGDDSLAQLARLLQGPECRALTVSDAPNFAAGGGMISLVTENKRVRLEVNVDAVRRAELRIDPQLLQVARPVKTSYAPGGPGR